MRVAVKHNLQALERGLGLYPDETLAAGVRAMNRSLATGRKTSVEDLKSSLPGLKVGTINRQIKLEKATRNRPLAAIEFSAKRFRLFGNLVKPSSRRVSLRRPPWRIESLDGDVIPPEALRRAFIQRSKRGSVQVWIREGGRRYPITALLAASLATTMSERRMTSPLADRMHERFTVVLAQEANYTLHKRGA